MHQRLHRIASSLKIWEQHSLDVLEIVMGIESEFGIKIPTEATENIVTAGDAFEAIKKEL